MKLPAITIKRPLVFLAICYGLGIVVGALTTRFTVLLPILGLLLAVFALALGWKQAGVRFTAACCGAFFLGVLLSGLAAHPSLPDEGSYRIRARVSGDVNRRDDGSAQAVLRSLLLTNEAGEQTALSAAWWTFYVDEKNPAFAFIGDGQEVSFQAQVYHPKGQRNPYGFDFSAFLLQRGMMVGVSGARDLALDQEARGVENPILRLRKSLSFRLAELFVDDGGLSRALLLGDRQGLDQATTADFRDAGLAHILAVSGLHVSLMMMALFFVLKRLRLSPRVLLGLIALLLLLYAWMLEFSPSIVRAGILTLLFLLGRVVKRRVDPLSSWSLAFLLILLFRPLDLFTLGFQLSFLAVLGIVLLGDRLTCLLHRCKLPWKVQKALSAYGMGLSATAFTAVPVVNAFHRLPLLGLLIGPLAIAVATVLLFSYLVLLPLSFLSMALAKALAVPFVLLTKAYLSGAHLVAQLPFGVLRLPEIPLLVAFLYYLALLVCTRYVRLRWRWRLPLLTGLLGVMLAVGFVKPEQALTYVQLDLGFADSAVILDQDTTFVIDAGLDGSELSSMLQSLGRKVDHLILTHLHFDHVGGLLQLLEDEVPIGEILLPAGALSAKGVEEAAQLIFLAQQQGIPVRMLGRGDTLSSKRVKGEVLWPYPFGVYPGLSPNDGSLVVYWELDGVSLLSTGDIGSGYAKYAQRPAQVMKAPHHGSRRDTDDALLQSVSAQVVLITADDRKTDRYQAAQERIAKTGALHLVTGQTGAITLLFDHGEMYIKTMLPQEEEHGL